MSKIDPSLLDGGRLLPLVEAFHTLQGEGYHAGRAAYFIRLGGCEAGCPWCDAKYTWNASRHPLTPVGAIVDGVREAGARTVVITGGEPLLYPLGPLTGALHDAGVEILLETSGAAPFSGEFDWVCLSPKRQMPPLDEAFVRASELKVVIASADDRAWAEACAARCTPACRLYMQAEWSVREEVTPLMVDYVKRHPEWRLGLQSHKYLQIP